MTDYYLGTDSELWLDFQNALDDAKIRVYAQALGEINVSGAGGMRMGKEINEAIEQRRIIADFRGLAGEQIRMKWAERALRGGKQLHLLNTNFCDFKVMRHCAIRVAPNR
jgi:hypothetical protein